MTGKAVAAPNRRARNLGSSYAALLASLAIGFATTPLLLRVLGEDRFGQWASVSGLLAVVALADVGLGAAITHLVARLHSDASASAGAITRTAVRFNLLLGTAATFIVVLGSDAIPTALNLTDGQARAAVVITALSFPPLLVSSTLDGYLFGVGRLDRVNALATATSLIRTLLVLGAGFFTGELVALASASTAATFGAVIARAFSARREGLLLSGLRTSKELVSETRRYAGHWYIVAVSSNLILRIDVFVAASLFGARAAALYAVLTTITGMGLGVVARATDWLVPDYSSEFTAKRTQFLLQTGANFSFFVSVLIAGLLLIGSDAFFRVWAHGVDVPRLAVFSLALVVVVEGIVHPLTVFLQGSGRVSVLSRVGVTEAIVNVSASILLARSVGVLGIAFGTALSRVVTVCVIRRAVARMEHRTRLIARRDLVAVSVWSAAALIFAPAVPLVALALASILVVYCGWNINLNARLLMQPAKVGRIG